MMCFYVLTACFLLLVFFFSSRRRHTRCLSDWSSDVCSSDLVFLRGQAGERFCVRNSGVTAVVEGVGDHGCEYMTKGLVLVLGRTGRNFAAGMSGGVAYVLDEDGSFRTRCNPGLVAVEAPEAGDVQTIHDLIQRHYDLTRSGVAWRLLSGWKETQKQFVRVMPVEYAKVLAKQHLDTEAARLASV